MIEKKFFLGIFHSYLAKAVSTMGYVRPDPLQKEFRILQRYEKNENIFRTCLE